MEVLQVVTSIAEEASGPSYSVPALCGALGSVGAKVTLHVLGSASASSERGYRIAQHRRWKSLYNLGISPEMKRALTASAATADIIHDNGLWQMPNVYPAWAARAAGCRLVTSPRGTFAPWALRRSRWRKRLLWWACQARAVRQSACFHATAEPEYKEIRRAGLRAPVAIIPNGIEIPELPPAQGAADGPRRLLFLGRIHPVKGVDLLIKAWRSVQASAPDWILEIVGPDNEGHMDRMQSLARDIGTERLVFHGPVYGRAKTEVYQRADLFVLPTHTENFGMAVAEALACGVPAIVSRGAPWPGLEQHGCGWWIEIGEGALTECLRTVLSLSREDLRERGGRGRAWMERDYSWNLVGKMMYETYLWVLGGGPPPPWVRRDG